MLFGKTQATNVLNETWLMKHQSWRYHMQLLHSRPLRRKNGYVGENMPAKMQDSLHSWPKSLSWRTLNIFSHCQVMSQVPISFTVYWDIRTSVSVLFQKSSDEHIRTVRHWIGWLFVPNTQQYNEQDERNKQLKHKHQLQQSQQRLYQI